MEINIAESAKTIEVVRDALTRRVAGREKLYHGSRGNPLGCSQPQMFAEALQLFFFDRNTTAYPERTVPLRSVPLFLRPSTNKLQA